MVQRADTEDVRRMLDEGAQLLEVLPRSHYDEEHLPGAISLPLRKINARSIQLLDLERPIVTYCYDYQCDLSARAAHLLEALGCTTVYDYTASKAAWMACGMPIEGTAATAERAGAVSKRISKFGLSSRVAQLRSMIREGDSRWVITDDADVVMGIVCDAGSDLPAHTPVAEIMDTAPPTVRPDVHVRKLAEDMDRDRRAYVLVTHLDGRLIGIIDRPDLEPASDAGPGDGRARRESTQASPVP